MDSNTLAATGVNDIGLISVSIARGGCFLGSGITSAVFQPAGTTPSLMELFKMAVRGAASILEKSRRIHAGTPSEPVALLTLIFLRAFSVVSTLMVNSSGTGSECLEYRVRFLQPRQGAADGYKEVIDVVSECC